MRFHNNTTAIAKKGYIVHATGIQSHTTPSYQDQTLRALDEPTGQNKVDTLPYRAITKSQLIIDKRIHQIFESYELVCKGSNGVITLPREHHAITTWLTALIMINRDYPIKISCTKSSVVSLTRDTWRYYNSHLSLEGFMSRSTYAKTSQVWSGRTYCIFAQQNETKWRKRKY